MIANIQLENFFSFGKQSIPSNSISLETDVNILIGINGSGKSNFLKAMQLLERVGSKGSLRQLILDEWGGMDAILNSTEQSSSSCHIVVEYKAEVIRKYGYATQYNVSHQISLSKIANSSNYSILEALFVKRDTVVKHLNLLYVDDGEGFLFDEYGEGKSVKYSNLDPQESALKQVVDPERYPLLAAIRKMLADIICYQSFNTAADSKMRRPVLATSERKLQNDGSNLAQILNTIKINDRASYNKINKALGDINYYFDSIEYNHIGSNLELLLSEKGLNKTIHTAHLSDGTLRLLCLLAIFLNKNRGCLVCLDEPEGGLHPDMIMVLSEVIIGLGSSTQFIIATHSDKLLDRFDIKKVRIFEKDENNQTIVNSFTEEQLAGWTDDYSLGKLWRTGDIGGNRW